MLLLVAFLFASPALAIWDVFEDIADVAEDGWDVLNDEVLDPIGDVIDEADNVVDDLGVPDIFNPFNDDYLFNPFNVAENIWEAGEAVVGVVFDSIENFVECIDDSFDDFIDMDNCELPTGNDSPSVSCGADSDDGLTGWCDFIGLGFNVHFGSLEPNGDQDTATFTAEFATLDYEMDFLKQEWMDSVLHDYFEIDATTDFLFVGAHSLTVGDGNLFTLSLPAVDLDIDASLSFAAETAEEPCADDEDKCTFILNKGKTTLIRESFAAGPVPVVIEFKAEVYLKALPKWYGAANAQFHVYLEEEVPLLNQVNFMLGDPEETLDQIVDMFNPIELFEALEENIRFEVTGEVEASASVTVCLGVVIGFHVNGIGIDVDLPVCLTVEFDAVAQGSLTGASASVSVAVVLEAIESTLVLTLPDAGVIVDTACAMAAMAASPPIDIDIGACVPLVGCIEDLANDVCDGLSSSASVDLEWELGSFTLTEEHVLWEYSGDWSTESGSGVTQVSSGATLAVKSDTGYCPSGYVPIIDKDLCEFYSENVLGLPDTNGAFVFTNSNPEHSRPQGCYWNGGNGNLAFNEGIFDANNDDGSRFIICAKDEAIVSPKGYCPVGYEAIITETECESIAIGVLNLPDSDGEAYGFVHDNADVSRPEGCYWNDNNSPSLVFNDGIYDSDANDGQRQIVCKHDGSAAAPVSTSTGPMAKKSSTGYCPSGYVAILDKALCEYYGLELLGLPDSNEEAYEFSNSDADVSRPQGCYWKGTSLAFNTGFYDPEADGDRKSICAKESGIVSPKGFCPTGYKAITTKTECESVGVDKLNLPDSDGEAYVFNHDDADVARPQGCYWNDKSSPNLAFNTGLFDSDANDGQRKIICTPEFPIGSMAKKSMTGFCPSGYLPIHDKTLCEYYGVELLGLPDTDGLAHEFSNSNADNSRPEGCYWNGGSSNTLAFNTGIYDAEANDGQRKIICAKESGIVSPKGYCPSGYAPITSESECESIAIDALLLPDSNGQANVFSHDDADESRPQGCYWNDGISLAFNTGLYDSEANDGQRQIICQPTFPEGPMVKLSETGYCPSNYVALLDKDLCEYYGLELLELTDSNGEAYGFSNSDADNSRPQGCYWMESTSSLAFNTGIYEADANDGERRIICAKETGIVSPKGYCPSGYEPITSESECEGIAIDALLLPDSNQQAFVFENSDASKSRPQGCYWNDKSSPNLAFNTGLFDSDANDGQRKIICKPSSEVRRLEESASTLKRLERLGARD